MTVALNIKKSRKHNIFFDLDGTILDISGKYYRIYFDFLTERGVRPMAKDNFWKIKKGKKDIQFLIHNQRLAEEFKDFFIRKVETAGYLKYDHPFSFAKAVLKVLKSRGFKLILVTLRRNKRELMQQLDKSGLKELFDLLLVEKQDLKSGDNYKSKIKAIRSYVKTGDILVGDTRADVQCGKKIGLKTFGVLSGLNNITNMKALKPDYVIRDIRSLLSALR